MKEINLFGIRKNGVTLCHFDNAKTRDLVVMKSITEHQEERIDKSKIYYGKLHFEDDDKDLIVEGHNILMYGKVDFNDDNDIDAIKRFNIINVDGCWMYSNFDYDKGIANINDNKTYTYPTWNPLDWFKYCHCMLGKPERIIVYKYNIKHKIY